MNNSVIAIRYSVWSSFYIILLSNSTLALKDIVEYESHVPETSAIINIEDAFIEISTRYPTNSPTTFRSTKPSRNPSRRPSTKPTKPPTWKPSRKPTTSPSTRPSSKPTISPTRKPSVIPTTKPSRTPPTTNPSKKPTMKPAFPTAKPTLLPYPKPTTKPTSPPSRKPTSIPSNKPTNKPTSPPNPIPTRLPFIVPLVLDISSDPYTTSTSYHATQVEPDNYAFGNTVVAVTQTGRFYNGGCNNICWATSTDSAMTWTSGCLSGLTAVSGGTFERASDPTVTYDLKHNTWLICYLLFKSDQSASGVGVSHSADGLTWSSSTTIVTRFSPWIDKNWIVCDNTPTSPYYGNCYVQYDTYAAGEFVYMSTSSDGGLTWCAPVQATSAFGIGGQPLVHPGGTVIVPYLSNGNILRSFRSLNGGSTWADQTVMATARFPGANAGIRFAVLPSAEIDGSGKVYVVWPDCRFRSVCDSNRSPYDLVYSTSSDGLTWSSPMRIPITPTSSSMSCFIPGIAVDMTTSGSSAHLAVTYYYLPDSACGTSGHGTCELYVGFISSKDAGTSWSDPITLAGPMDLTWIAPTTGGIMVGDYISTAFLSNGKAVPVFSNAHTIVGNKRDQRLATVKGGISV